MTEKTNCLCGHAEMMHIAGVCQRCKCAAYQHDHEHVYESSGPGVAACACGSTIRTRFALDFTRKDLAASPATAWEPPDEACNFMRWERRQAQPCWEVFPKDQTSWCGRCLMTRGLPPSPETT